MPIIGRMISLLGLYQNSTWVGMPEAYLSNASIIIWGKFSLLVLPSVNLCKPTVRVFQKWQSRQCVEWQGFAINVFLHCSLVCLEELSSWMSNYDQDDMNCPWQSSPWRCLEKALSIFIWKMRYKAQGLRSMPSSQRAQAKIQNLRSIKWFIL